MTLLEEIKEDSQNRLVVAFIGVGAAFAKKNNQTSLLLARHGKTLLIDVGTTIPKEFYVQGCDIHDIDYYHITHSHADHIGGLEELFLMARYVKKKKVPLIITHTYQQILWNDSLRGGMEINEDGLCKFTDYMTPIRPEWVKASPREIYKIENELGEIYIFRTIHVPGGVDNWEKAFWSTGILIPGKVLFTADTRFDPAIFEDLPLKGNELIFHDCQLFDPGTVHATYTELKTLPEDLRRRIYLTHYGDNFEKFNPIQDGFLGFAKPWNERQIRI